jgi:hypothetical protein
MSKRHVLNMLFADVDGARKEKDDSDAFLHQLGRFCRWVGDVSDGLFEIVILYADCSPGITGSA